MHQIPESYQSHAAIKNSAVLKLTGAFGGRLESIFLKLESHKNASMVNFKVMLEANSS